MRPRHEVGEGMVYHMALGYPCPAPTKLPPLDGSPAKSTEADGSLSPTRRPRRRKDRHDDDDASAAQTPAALNDAQQLSLAGGHAGSSPKASSSTDTPSSQNHSADKDAAAQLRDLRDLAARSKLLQNGFLCDEATGMLKPLGYVSHDRAPRIIKKPYLPRGYDPNDRNPKRKLATVEKVFDAYAQGANRRLMHVENALESKEKQETRRIKMEQDAIQRLRDAAVKMKMVEWEKKRDFSCQEDTIRRQEAEQRKLIREQERAAKLPVEAWWERVTTRWVVKQERLERAVVRRQRQLERLERLKLLTAELAAAEGDRRKVLRHEEAKVWLWIEREDVHVLENTLRLRGQKEQRVEMKSLLRAFDREAAGIQAHAKHIADMRHRRHIEREHTLFEEEARRKAIADTQWIGYEGLLKACCAGILDILDAIQEREVQRKAAHAKMLDDQRQAVVAMVKSETEARRAVDDEQTEVRKGFFLTRMDDYSVALKKHNAAMEIVMSKVRDIQDTERETFEAAEERARVRLIREEERCGEYCITWLAEMNDFATRPIALVCPSADKLGDFVPDLSGLHYPDVLYKFECLYGGQNEDGDRRLTRGVTALTVPPLPGHIQDMELPDVEVTESSVFIAEGPTLLDAVPSSRKSADDDGDNTTSNASPRAWNLDLAGVEHARSVASGDAASPRDLSPVKSLDVDGVASGTESGSGGDGEMVTAGSSYTVQVQDDEYVVCAERERELDALAQSCRLDLDLAAAEEDQPGQELQWWPTPTVAGQNHNVYVHGGDAVLLYSDLNIASRSSLGGMASGEPSSLALTGTVKVRVSLVHGMEPGDFLTFNAEHVKAFYQDSPKPYRFVPYQGLFFVEGDRVAQVGETFPQWDPTTWSLEYSLDLGLAFLDIVDDAACMPFEPIAEFVRTVAFKSTQHASTEKPPRSIRVMLEVVFDTDSGPIVYYAPCTLCLTQPALLLDSSERPTQDVAFFTPPKATEDPTAVHLLETPFLQAPWHERIDAREMFKGATMTVKFSSDFVADGDRLGIAKGHGISISTKKGTVSVNGQEVLKAKEPSKCPFFQPSLPFVPGREVEFLIVAQAKKKERESPTGGGFAARIRGGLLGRAEEGDRSPRGGRSLDAPASPRGQRKISRIDEVLEQLEPLHVLHRLKLVLQALTFVSTSPDVPRRDVVIQVRSPYLSVPIFSFQVGVKYEGEQVYLMHSMPGSGDVSVSFMLPPSGCAKGYEDLFNPVARVFPKVCIQTSWETDDLPPGCRVSVTLPKGAARDHLLLQPPKGIQLVDRGIGNTPMASIPVTPANPALEPVPSYTRKQTQTLRRDQAPLRPLSLNKIERKQTQVIRRDRDRGADGAASDASSPVMAPVTASGSLSTFYTLLWEQPQPYGNARPVDIGVLSITENTGCPILVMDFENAVATVLVEELIRSVAYRCDARAVVKNGKGEQALLAVLVLEHRPGGHTGPVSPVSPPSAAHLVPSPSEKADPPAVALPTIPGVRMVSTPPMTPRFQSLSVRQAIHIRSALFDIPVHCVTQDYKEGQGLKRLATFETECDGSQPDDFIFKGQLVCEVRDPLPEDKFKLVLPKHSDFVVATVGNKGYVTVGDRQIGWFYNSASACGGHLVFEIVPKKGQAPISIKKDVMGLLKNMYYLNESRDPEPSRVLTVALRGDTGMSQVCMQLNVQAVNDPTVVEIPQPMLNYVPNVKKAYPGKLIAEGATLSDPDTTKIVFGAFLIVENAGGYMTGDKFAFLTRDQQRVVYPNAPHYLDVKDDGKSLCVDGRWTATVVSTSSVHEKHLTVRFTGIAKDTFMPMSAGGYVLGCIVYRSSAPTPKPGKRSFHIRFNAGDQPIGDAKTKVTLHVLPPLLHAPSARLQYLEGSGQLCVTQKVSSGAYTSSSHFKSCTMWVEIAEGFLEEEDKICFVVDKGRGDFFVKDTSVYVKGNKNPIATLHRDETGRKVALQCFDDKLKGTGVRFPQLFRCFHYENLSRDPQDDPRTLRLGLVIDGETSEVDVELDVIPIDDMTEVVLEKTSVHYVLGQPQPRLCFEGAKVHDADTPVFYAPKSYLKVEAPLSPEHEMMTLCEGDGSDVVMVATENRDVFNVEVREGFCGKMVLRKKGGFHIELDDCPLEDLQTLVQAIVYQSKPSALTAQAFKRATNRTILLMIRGGPHVQPTKVTLPIQIIPAFLDQPLLLDTKRDRTLRPIPMLPQPVNVTSMTGLRYVQPLSVMPHTLDLFTCAFEEAPADHPFVFILENNSKQFTVKTVARCGTDGVIAEVWEGNDRIARVSGLLLPDPLERPCSEELSVKFLVTRRRKVQERTEEQSMERIHAARVNGVLQMLGVLHRDDDMSAMALVQAEGGEFHLPTARAALTLASEADPSLTCTGYAKVKTTAGAFMSLGG